MSVYFIRAGAFGDVKIGHAKDPPARHPDAPAPQPEPAQAEVGA